MLPMDLWQASVVARQVAEGSHLKAGRGLFSALAKVYYCHFRPTT
jgi:hypothetical protein